MHKFYLIQLFKFMFFRIINSKATNRAAYKDGFGKLINNPHEANNFMKITDFLVVNHYQKKKNFIAVIFI